MEDMDLERENLLEQWQDLLTDKNLRALKAALTEANEVDVAEFVQELDPERTVLVFRMLPKEVASDVFANLEPEDQAVAVQAHKMIQAAIAKFC